MRTHRIQLPLRGAASIVVAWAMLVSACGSEPSEATEAASKTARAAEEESAASSVARVSAPPIVIAQGSPVEIRNHLVSGQITLFDFTSEYCPPCRVFEPYLDRLNQERPDLTVVKVDINRPGRRGIDWRSPVAQQYRLGQIPHFKVFDASGNLMAEGEPAKQLVIQWINELVEAQG